MKKIVLTALMSATAVSAFAAETEAVDEVVVTGTLIRGIAPVGSPSATVDSAAIIASGTTNTADLLATQPALNSFNTTPIGGNQAFRSTGSTVPGMRGLPGTAVLVMLDGHRLVGDSPLLSTGDPSSIPAAAIERIEIIQDGGSATYGSDAVAGVINIILRKNFSGAETSSSFTAANNYTAGNFSQLFGKTWSGGSGLIAATYEQNSDFVNTDRSYYTQDFRQYGGRANLSVSCGKDLPSQQIGPSRVNVVFEDGRVYDSSTMTRLPTNGFTPAQGLSATTPARAVTLPVTQVVTCDPVRNNQVLIPNRKIAAVANFRQDIGERLSLFGDFKFTDQFSVGRYQPSNLVVNDPTLNTTPGARQVTATLVIPSTNPFFKFPAGFTPVAGQTYTEQVFVNTSIFGALGEINNEYRGRSYMADVGATFDLWGDWQANGDFNFGYGDSSTYNPLSTGPNPNALLAAAYGTTTATALDPFEGRTSTAVIQSIMNWPLYFLATQKIYDVNLRADGSLFDIPGGTIKAAIGVANRHEQYEGDGPIGVPGQRYYTVNPQESSRVVNAVFAEINVPLVGASNAFTGVQRLSLALAGRYDHFSDFGGTTNPKIGLTWAPIDSLTVRGSYGTSFHAPQLADISAVDTRASANVTGGGTTAPTNFPTQLGLPLLTFAGGRPGLKPEEAKTYSFGVDFKPEFVPGLSLSATYFDIKFENQINITQNLATLVNDKTYPAFLYNQISTTGCSTVAATRGDPVAAGTGGPCYAPIPQAQLDALLSGVRKLNFFGTPTTWLVSADQRRGNNAANIVHGIDWDFTYRLDLAGGTLSAGTSGEYLLKYLTQVAQGAAFLDTLENGSPFFRGDAGAQLIIPWHVRGNVGWQEGAFGAQAVLNYTGSYKWAYNTYDYTGTNTNGAIVQPSVAGVQQFLLQTVDPFITVDVNTSYNFPAESGWLKGVRAQVNLYNVFNTRPPFAYPFQNTNTDYPGYFSPGASPLGRTGRLTLTKSW